MSKLSHRGEDSLGSQVVLKVVVFITRSILAYIFKVYLRGIQIEGSIVLLGISRYVFFIGNFNSLLIQAMLLKGLLFYWVFQGMYLS